MRLPDSRLRNSSDLVRGRVAVNRQARIVTSASAAQVVGPLGAPSPVRRKDGEALAEMFCRDRAADPFDLPYFAEIAGESAEQGKILVFTDGSMAALTGGTATVLKGEQAHRLNKVARGYTPLVQQTFTRVKDQAVLKAVHGERLEAAERRTILELTQSEASKPACSFVRKRAAERMARLFRLGASLDSKGKSRFEALAREFWAD